MLEIPSKRGSKAYKRLRKQLPTQRGIRVLQNKLLAADKEDSFNDEESHLEGLPIRNFQELREFLSELSMVEKKR